MSTKVTLVYSLTCGELHTAFKREPHHDDAKKLVLELGLYVPAPGVARRVLRDLLHCEVVLEAPAGGGAVDHDQDHRPHDGTMHLELHSRMHEDLLS